jgi:hypothetical protein
MDKIFNITDNYGKFLCLYKRTVSREIKRFKKILSPFKIFEIKSEVFDVGLAAIILAYDEPDDVVLET